MATVKEALNDESMGNVTGGTKIPYAIQPNDTLQTIADRFHCSVEQLCRWNNIKESDALQPNRTLFIRF
ncbi:MAG: LysM peptidoglycan-binding domain-containing protein [Oscillospiraceae bacterium]|nr:LysM peptidoglycan-binding domain-containing protein [Oscillospiraceae bacterium]